MNETIIDTSRRVSKTARVGFSLIELMLVIVIGGILAGAVTYGAFVLMRRASQTSTKSTLDAVKFAIMNYKADKGEYPKQLSDLVNAGFLKKPLPKDAWEHNLVYRFTPDGEDPYDLYSYGPDGKGGNKASRIYPSK